MEGLDIMTFHKHTEIIETNGKSLKTAKAELRFRGCQVKVIWLAGWQVFCCAFGRILHITGRILIIRTRKLRALFGTTFVCAGAHNNHDKSPEFRILETVLRLDKHGLRI